MGLYNTLMEMAIQDESSKEFTERREINEGFFNKSPDGEKLKKDLQDKCKSICEKYRNKRSQGGIKAFFKDNTNNMSKEMLSYMKSKFDALWYGSMVITYYNYVPVDCSITTWGLYKHRLYKVVLHLTSASVTVFGVLEKELEDIDIPEDIIKYALDNIRCGITSDLKFSKHKISNAGRDAVSKIINYVDMKHKDYIAKKIFISSVSIKKAKGE